MWCLFHCRTPCCSPQRHIHAAMMNVLGSHSNSQLVHSCKAAALSSVSLSWRHHYAFCWIMQFKLKRARKMLGSGQRERRLPTVEGTVVKEIKTKMVRLKNERSGAATDSEFSCLPQLIFHRKSDPVPSLHFQCTFCTFQTEPHICLEAGFPVRFWDRSCLSEEPGSAGAECSTCIRPLNYSALWIIESRHSFLGPRLGATSEAGRKSGENNPDSLSLSDGITGLLAQRWMLQNSTFGKDAVLCSVVLPHRI